MRVWKLLMSWINLIANLSSVAGMSLVKACSQVPAIFEMKGSQISSLKFRVFFWPYFSPSLLQIAYALVNMDL